MDVNSFNSVTSSIATSSTYAASAASKSKEAPEKETKPISKDVAAVYEKSTDASAAKTAGNASAKKNIDRDAVVAKLKSDMESQKAQLFDIVRKSIGGQGKSFGLASDDDMWKFLAGGDFTVDAATKAQAQADIAEDGYWGVNKTSDRILDFAKALSGNDPSKAEELLGAFKKGFEEATKTWGKDLPDISSKTYDAVLEKFDKWKNGEE